MVEAKPGFSDLDEKSQADTEKPAVASLVEDASPEPAQEPAEVVAKKPVEPEKPSEPEKPTTMVMNFRREDGSMVEHTFTRRPIGLNYKPQVPAVVGEVHPDMQAGKQGVQLGWTIVSVNGESLVAGEFADIGAKIRTAALQLPEDPQVPSVVVTFRRPDGSSVTHTFTRRPLGFHIRKNTVPVVVGGVALGSQARTRGVQIGWSLVDINRESVETGDYATVSDRLKAAALTLPEGAVTTPEGQ